MVNPRRSTGVGETLRQGVVREVLEETGLVVVAGAMIEWLDRITPDASGRIRYHYVLVDFLCHVTGGALLSGSDADEARWAGPGELSQYKLAPVTLGVIENALSRETAFVPPSNPVP